MVGFVSEEPKRPILGEIASIAPERDITRAWVGELLEFDDPISLPLADRFELFTRVATDVQVAALMQQRRMAILRHRWEVEPGASPGSDPSRLDKKAADFIRALLSVMPFDRLTGELHWGVWFGFAVAEANYAKDGAQIVLDPDVSSAGQYQGLKVRDRSRFRFHRDGGLRLLTPQNQIQGEALPGRKFLTFTSGGTFSDQVGGSPLALLAFQYVLFRREDWREWLRFLKKQAQGSVYGEFDQPEHATKLNQVITALRNGGGGSIPRGTILHELALASGAAADFATVDERIDAALAKLILGQVGTSEGVLGQHRGDMQHDVRQDLIISDSDLICSALNRGPVTWLTEWNFPGAVPPTVSRKIESAPDLDAAAERDNKIWALGFAPKIEYVTDLYGEGYVGAGADNSLPAIPEGRLPSVIQVVEKVSGGALTVEQGRVLLLHILPGITPEIAEQLIVEPPQDPDSNPEAVIEEFLSQGGDPTAPGDAVATPGQESAPTPPGEADPAEFSLEDNPAEPDTVDLMAARLAEQAAPIVDGWMAQIRELGQNSVDLQDFAARIYDLYPELAGDQLTQIMGEAMEAASWAGAFEAQEAQGEVGEPEFAAPKQKKCVKGKSCGFACISANKQCLRELPVGARRAARKMATGLPKGRSSGGSKSAPPDQSSALKVLQEGTVITHPALNSTVTDAALDKALTDLESDENREELARLRDYLARREDQAVFFRGLAVSGIQADELSAQVKDPGTRSLLSRNGELPNSTELGLDGYASKALGLVVVATDSDFAPSATRIKELVANSIKKGSDEVLGESNSLQGGSDQALITYLHELGHRIHYAAGAPDSPALGTGLTSYSQTNKYEFAAEHIAAYFIAPVALRQKSPKIYDWVAGVVKAGADAPPPAKFDRARFERYADDDN
jgi:phage gp29-like protein